MKLRLSRCLFLIVIFISHLVNADDDSDYEYNYFTSNKCTVIYDPYEKLNRRIFDFNIALDRLVAKPLAKGYNKVTNDYTRARVGSFFNNLTTPLSALNYLLQGNFNDTMRSVWRFLINTSLGVGGLFDVAAKIELYPAPQSFSNTLAHYGAKPGPYFVLPLLGSNMGRDMFDAFLLNSAVGISTKIPENVNLTLIAVESIHDRSLLLPLTDSFEENSMDYYLSVRTSVFQNRESKMNYPKSFNCLSYEQKSIKNEKH